MIKRIIRDYFDALIPIILTPEICALSGALLARRKLSKIVINGHFSRAGLTCQMSPNTKKPLKILCYMLEF
jgi:hypothetical protein